jgi:hypothetical protein
MYKLENIHTFINERITVSDLKSIEKYADSLFKKVGIDVEFTKHFLDRVNDERNVKQITPAELEGIFRRTYKMHGKKIPLLGDDAEAVIRDMRSDINMPFVLDYDSKTQEFELIAKTVMRKKNFLTRDVKLDINSYKLNELRDKSIYKQMRPMFDSTPEYVFRELFYANNGFFKSTFMSMLDSGEEDDIEDTFIEWIDLKWTKQVISVNINDFTKNTQKEMASRGMGSIHLTDVPSDSERTSTQQDIAKKTAQGKNEPVILIKSRGGYELIEGWHRTMSILSLGSDGTMNYNKWDKVKLNAWVATGQYTEDIIKSFGTFK